MIPTGPLLGQRLAERLGLGVGDSIPLLDAKVEVIGIFRQASVLNESAMILPLPLDAKASGQGRKSHGDQPSSLSSG